MSDMRCDAAVVGGPLRLFRDDDAAGRSRRGAVTGVASTPEVPVRFLTVHTPGGFEQMHRDVCHAERQAGRAFAAAEIVPIAARHDWTLAGPPLLPTGELACGPVPRPTDRPA
jgi:hypothetical protein